MLVSELSERYAVKVRNPEDRILASMVNGERMFAEIAEISFLASAAATFDSSV